MFKFPRLHRSKQSARVAATTPVVTPCFTPRPVNEHAFDDDFDAVRAVPVTGVDAFGYFST